MDFANAVERDSMEQIVEDIERLCRDCENEIGRYRFL